MRTMVSMIATPTASARTKATLLILLAVMLLLHATAVDGARSKPRQCKGGPKKITVQQAIDLVTPFYTRGLTVNNVTGEPAATLSRILDDDMKSFNGFLTATVDDSSDEVFKTKNETIGLFTAFWSLIPDMQWLPVDFVVGGTPGCLSCNNKVVVRSIASGHPARGNFMGVDVDGTQGFKIDTIDIHEIECGKSIHKIWHLEDWNAAIQQLSA